MTVKYYAIPLVGFSHCLPFFVMRNMALKSSLYKICLNEVQEIYYLYTKTKTWYTETDFRFEMNIKIRSQKYNIDFVATNYKVESNVNIPLLKIMQISLLMTDRQMFHIHCGIYQKEIVQYLLSRKLNSIFLLYIKIFIYGDKNLHLFKYLNFEQLDHLLKKGKLISNHRKKLMLNQII